tara:strand:- start:205 stop:354 length:150 start_codon:yes stop_codon:yes gene_type:complete
MGDKTVNFFEAVLALVGLDIYDAINMGVLGVVFAFIAIAWAAVLGLFNN